MRAPKPIYVAKSSPKDLLQLGWIANLTLLKFGRDHMRKRCLRQLRSLCNQRTSAISDIFIEQKLLFRILKRRMGG